MRRPSALILAVSVVLASLAGCGGVDSGSKQISEKFAPEQEPVPKSKANAQKAAHSDRD